MFLQLRLHALFRGADCSFSPGSSAGVRMWHQANPTQAYCRCWAEPAALSSRELHPLLRGDPPVAMNPASHLESPTGTPPLSPDAPSSSFQAWVALQPPSRESCFNGHQPAIQSSYWRIYIKLHTQSRPELGSGSSVFLSTNSDAGSVLAGKNSQLSL